MGFKPGFYIISGNITRLKKICRKTLSMEPTFLMLKDY